MITSLSSFFGNDFIFGFLIFLFIAEFVVGIVQLIGALVRTIIRLNSGNGIGNLKLYWIMVACYFLVGGILYAVYMWTVESQNIYDYSSNDNYESFESIMHVQQILMVCSIIWIAVAWGIAIWYWTKVVFTKKQIKAPENV